MFKWAKSEVAGFDDLSPLDQKALLRKTVAELVMLGFARGSIAYDSKYKYILGLIVAIIVGIPSISALSNRSARQERFNQKSFPHSYNCIPIVYNCDPYSHRRAVAREHGCCTHAL